MLQQVQQDKVLLRVLAFSARQYSLFVYLGQAVQAVAGCVLPQALAPVGSRGGAGRRLSGYMGGYAPAAEAVGAYAAAAARSGGRQLLVLGEAGYKAVSARVSTWRSGDGGLSRCGAVRVYGGVRIAGGAGAGRCLAAAAS